MADYKTYLAASILTEEKAITYRLLSRALKVHVNAAKEMLYEFHKVQNSKRPGTIHATYLISGTIRAQATNGGAAKKDPDGDDYMQSSPFISSSMPQPEKDQRAADHLVLSISLVREEDLAQIRSEYEHINSIHVYSLMLHPLKDLQILSDVNRELLDLCASEDPLDSLSKYGTITNPNVRRRKAGATRPPSAPLPAQVKAQPAKPNPPEQKPAPKKEGPQGKPSTASEFFGKGKEKLKAKSTAADNNSSKESTPNPPTLKRESSSLMKSFAKAKPKLERKRTESSAVSPAISAAEDSPMKDVSDDEEENYVPPPSKVIVDSNRQTKKEKEAALRALMDDDDEDEPAAPTKPEEPEEGEEEAKEEPEPIEPKDEVAVSGGRRRGRRRVMQKKKIKDEDGYLVTKQEMGWESFSEDEPVAKPKPKPQPACTTTKKKPTTKPGQGNIMSFFGKK